MTGQCLANNGPREYTWLYFGAPSFLAKPGIALLGGMKVGQLHQSSQDRDPPALKMGGGRNNLSMVHAGTLEDTEISLGFKEDIRIT